MQRSNLRADRLVSLYFFNPILQRLPAGEGVRIPILMYHSISDPGQHNGHPYYGTETPLSVFANQMKFLSISNYAAISLDEAVKHIEAGQPITKKCVVLTFDDGYQDFYTQAFPVLRNYGFAASVFLPTAYIADASKRFSGKDFLAWREVHELHRAGITFGSHTVTHPQLRYLSWKNIEDEVRCSKETIEEQLGASVRSFSYPFAFPESDRGFRKRLREILQSCGYQNGVSTIIGTTGRDADRFFMKRLPVNSFDDLHLFRAKLNGAYDWVHVPQLLFKSIRQVTAPWQDLNHRSD